MKTWGIYILAALGFVVYGAATDVDRDETGAIVGGGTVDAFNMRVGDCFNDTDSYSEEITSVPGVPCSDAHDNEAFAVFDLTIADFPGHDEMGVLAFDSCMAKFEGFVGREYESSSLEITTMYPTQGSWAEDDREVVCAVYNMETNQLLGSARGSGL